MLSSGTRTELVSAGYALLTRILTAYEHFEAQNSVSFYSKDRRFVTNIPVLAPLSSDNIIFKIKMTLRAENLSTGKSACVSATVHTKTRINWPDIFKYKIRLSNT
jgi:hypothetical protein